MLIGLQSNVESAALLFIVFLQSEEYSVWGILSSQTRKNFQNVVAFLGLCNLFHKLEIALRLN